jgi:hypothetical protein
VRQLLKEMKHQRVNYNKIMLSFTRNDIGQDHFKSTQAAGSQQERQDVVIGRREEENIWKKKMRLARSRRMSELEMKHTASKKLILRD